MKNKVNLIGRVVEEVFPITKVKETEFLIFTIAVSKGWKEKKKTTFIPIKVFGKKALWVSKILDKGALVAIEAEINITSIETQEKGWQTYWSIILSDFERLSSFKKNLVDETDETNLADETTEINLADENLKNLTKETTEVNEKISEEPSERPWELEI